MATELPVDRIRHIEDALRAHEFENELPNLAEQVPIRRCDAHDGELAA